MTDGNNFYYGKEADVVAGAANAAARLMTDFASYGVSTVQNTSFQAVNTSLQTAYATAIEPTTRTPVAIRGKDLAITAMRRQAVLLAKIIYATPTVTDAQLAGLGLLPRTSRAPIHVPTEAPTLTATGVVGRTVSIRLRDASSPARRGKARGATGANIYSFVGPAAPADPREYHYEGTLTRITGQILFPNTVASGATVWLSAAWVSARGQTSPACEPVSVTVQGGAVVPSAA